MKVLRLSSAFEPPATVQTERGVVPVGGMHTHAAELSRVLDARGVTQTVVTSRPPGTVEREPFGRYGEVLRVGRPIPVWRQFHGLPAGRLASRLAADVDLVHAHIGEDLGTVPVAVRAARR